MAAFAVADEVEMNEEELEDLLGSSADDNDIGKGKGKASVNEGNVEGKGIAPTQEEKEEEEVSTRS